MKTKNSLHEKLNMMYYYDIYIYMIMVFNRRNHLYVTVFNFSTPNLK